MFRVLAMGLLLGCGALVSGGCGGGSSGPNPNTSAGLGTLFVNVSSSNGNAVILERVTGPVFRIVRPPFRGRAEFFNIPPGRYSVSGDGFASASRSVDIVADQTLTVSLS